MESGNPSVSIDLLVGSLLANGQFFFKKFRELPRALRVKTFELLTCCHTHRCAAIQTVVNYLSQHYKVICPSSCYANVGTCVANIVTICLVVQ